MIQQVHNTIEVLQEDPELVIQTHESALEVSEVVQLLTIEQSDTELCVTEASQELSITDAPTPMLEIMPNAMLVQQFFSGEGAVADQDTILGDGTQFDVLRAPDMLRISLKLGEFETHADKVEARDNLGLNVIDGGTFT